MKEQPRRFYLLLQHWDCRLDHRLLLWRCGGLCFHGCACWMTDDRRTIGSSEQIVSFFISTGPGSDPLSAPGCSASLQLVMSSGRLLRSARGINTYMRPPRRPRPAVAAARNLTVDTQAQQKHVRPLRPWPQPVVESHGDYRADALLLERHIGGPLYEHQSNLPSLPVPTIEETLNRFLPSALPLAESDAERERLLEACKAFPGQAAKLQRRLQSRYEESQSQSTSWLQLWWNTWGYLQVREPVVPHVSYFFQLADDGTLPSHGKKSLGVMRGATILQAVGEYRRRVCSGSLPCEMIGRKDPKTPLCSAAFKYMFHACRIPARSQDAYRMYDPSRHRHCVVANKGYFFAVDFVDGDGDPLPFCILEERLQRCVDMAEGMQSMRGTRTVPRIGLLTASDRDSWADVRGRLLDAGGEPMGRALERLESGAFLLCLDDNEPLSLRQCGINYWHGGAESGRNRWFDKSMQFVCTRNGKVGFIGEHSMMDGMPAVNLCAHVVNTKYSECSSNNGGANSDHCSASGGVEHIFNDCIEALEGNAVVHNDVDQAGV